MSQSSKVVLVGHCGPDSFMLRTAVGRILPGAEILMVNDASTLDAHMTDDHLFLVNRVLDGSFATGNGIELIERIAQQDGAPNCLLISNYDDAQEHAESVGARPGFGTTELYSEKAASRLRDAAGVADSE